MARLVPGIYVGRLPKVCHHPDLDIPDKPSHDG
jgi:hypothetical protein